MSGEQRDERDGPTAHFDGQAAAKYDQKWEKLAALKEALHLLTGAVLAELPAEARILCVGAGTGAEILHLAERFPGWRFVAVDPSGPMLEVCRRRLTEHGFASRCEFVEGYIESVGNDGPFDAATSILVSQFILERDRRRDFFREIGRRLRPGGWLVSADLASDQASPAYEALLGVWLRMMRGAGFDAESLERLRTAYGTDVAVLPADEVAALISGAGFGAPTLFHQAALIHAWFARWNGAPDK